jgi:2-dehydro-3-deoxygalactonokinase
MTPDWIAIDWGTTNLRGWAMGQGGILAQAQSDQGMSRLSRDGFEPALLDMIAPWLVTGATIPVIACGMVGSRQGWHEATYRTVPCTPLPRAAMVSVPVQDRRFALYIAPGLKQENPADVMRGEETQIAGVLALHPQFDGALCLPGTHSKWAQISAGEVVSFQTYMTGEMFALLSQHSVLSAGLSGADWDDNAFDSGVRDGMARPERILALLFRLRAEGLIAGLSPSAAKARLSGLLIGSELAAAKAYWLGNRVALVGSSVLTAAYARALALQGVQAQCLSASDCTLAGLAFAKGNYERAAE